MASSSMSERAPSVLSIGSTATGFSEFAGEKELRRRRADSTGLGGDILREGWLLKEAGVYGDAPQRMLERMKRVLPKKRYCVLFASKLAYYAEGTAKLKHAGDGLGLEVNEFNAVVRLAHGSSAAKELKEGDVLTEVDGENVVGEVITDILARRRADARGKRASGGVRTVRYMRLKGYVPLGRGVEVRKCGSLLRRINSNAEAFEIDLANADNSTAHEHPKAKYVFICQGTADAREWRSALMRACPPSVLGRGGMANRPVDIAKAMAEAIAERERMERHASADARAAQLEDGSLEDALAAAAAPRSTAATTVAQQDQDQDENHG